MRMKDMVTKNYINRPDVFADIFNYCLYNGEKKIKPEELTELDITEKFISERTGKRKNKGVVAVEKYRDVKKLFQDSRYRCLILGVEEQSNIHYAMPVRTLVYDAMAYQKQIWEIHKKHQRNKDIASDSDEFLSGFYRKDRITPVITLVIYLGEKGWDGPRSLKEMMGWTGGDAESYIQDYKLNLLIPSEMEDNEIDKLESSLREVFLFLKYSNDWTKLEKIIKKEHRFHNIDTDAAMVISELTNTGIKINEKEEVQDMCEAIEQMKRLAKEEGMQSGKEEIVIKMYRRGYDYEEIADITCLEKEKVKAIICMQMEVKK